MIVLLTKPATKSDIKKASSDYPNYVKITIDIGNKHVVIGGEYHYDAEQLLLDNGSQQKNIWGGGLELSSRTLETIAMINVQPRKNAHQEIQDLNIKKIFLEIAYKYLSEYADKPTILL